MEFPRFVYRKPARPLPNGDRYEYEQVTSESSIAAKLAAGWFATRDEALGLVQSAPVVVSVASVEVTDDNAPPTRAELEQKAQELGIKVDGRQSDKTLAAKIAEALNGGMDKA